MIPRIALAIMLVTAAALGCSSTPAPKPLPGGPPPEYEPPRDFPGGAVGDHMPGAAPSETPIAPPHP